MKTVGAGFAGRIHHRAIAAELSAVRVGEYREFGDGLNAEGSAQHARTRPVGPEALNVDVVQKIRLAFRPCAGNAEVSLQAVQQVRAPGWGSDPVSRCDSWRQRDEVRKIAAVQRQVRNLFLFDYRGKSRRNDVHLGGLSFDRDRLLLLAGRKRNVHHHLAADGGRYAPADYGLKSHGRCLHFIGAHDQIHHRVAALRIGCHRLPDACGNVCNLHRRVGHNRPGYIRYGA